MAAQSIFWLNNHQGNGSVAQFGGNLLSAMEVVSHMLYHTCLISLIGLKCRPIHYSFWLFAARNHPSCAQAIARFECSHIMSLHREDKHSISAAPVHEPPGMELIRDDQT